LSPFVAPPRGRFSLALQHRDSPFRWTFFFIDRSFPLTPSKSCRVVNSALAIQLSVSPHRPFLLIETPRRSELPLPSSFTHSSFPSVVSPDLPSCLKCFTFQRSGVLFGWVVVLVVWLFSSPDLSCDIKEIALPVSFSSQFFLRSSITYR